MSDNDLDYSQIIEWMAKNGRGGPEETDALNALDRLRARVAELEIENKRLRQHLIGQIQSDAQDMGCMEGVSNE